MLLGDGASTRGDDPIDVVQDTKKFKIPVYTVALGHPERHAHAHRPEHRRDQHRARPAGPADAAGHRARHRRPVLRHRRRAPAEAVYRNLGTRLTKTKEKQQVTSAFAGGALVLLLAGAGLGLGARAGGCP